MCYFIPERSNSYSGQRYIVVHHQDLLFSGCYNVEKSGRRKNNRIRLRLNHEIEEFLSESFFVNLGVTLNMVVRSTV